MAFAGEMQIPRSARDDRGSQRGVAGGGPPRLYIPASVFLCALRVSAVKTRLYRITGHKTRVTDSFQIPRLMRPDASRTHNACAVGGRGLSPSPGGASALLGEQGALAGQAQAVAAERAASAHHAVAGDDERHRVRATGGADGAGGPRLADGPGDFAVGARLAVGDAAQLFPDADLEGGAADIERQGEGRVAGFG